MDEPKEEIVTRQTVDVPLELMQHFDSQKRIRRFRSFGAFVLSLIRQDMGRTGESAPAQAPVAPRPLRHAEYHAMLDTILDHGEEKDATGIKANLEWGSESVKRRTKRANFSRKEKAG